jgi:hypothetical protein
MKSGERWARMEEVVKDVDEAARQACHAHGPTARQFVQQSSQI